MFFVKELPDETWGVSIEAVNLCGSSSSLAWSKVGFKYSEENFDNIYFKIHS